MIIYPIVRWSDCDFCLGYDEGRKKLTIRKFGIIIGANQNIAGYYRFFLWGPAWIFLIRGEKYYFVNKRSGEEIWMGDENLFFKEISGSILSTYVVTYGNKWQLLSYSFAKLNVSKIDPAWDQFDETTENLVAWALDVQATQRSRQ